MTTLTCSVCGADFERPGKRGPIPKYCSNTCKRTPHRERKRAYDRRYYREVTLNDPEQIANRARCRRRYMQRPEVKERMRLRWQDPHYREQQNARRRVVVHPEVSVPEPYSGHRWLEMAREAVMPYRDLDGSAPWADGYYDEMGEAVLALLEGRDMSEAVKEFRRKEYVPRRLTYHMGDYKDDNGAENWFDRAIGMAESAEDEAVGRENIGTLVRTRFKNTSTKGRRMRHKTQQPSRRRQKDSGINDLRRAA